MNKKQSFIVLIIICLAISIFLIEVLLMNSSIVRKLFLAGFVLFGVLLHLSIIWNCFFNHKEIKIKNNVLVGDDKVFVFCVDELNVKTFSDFKEIKKLSLKNLNIKTIDKATFIGFDKLVSIEFPECLERIEDYAFCDCKSLTEITIPESVKYIGENCFVGCDKLTKVNFQITESQILKNDQDKVVIKNIEYGKLSYLDNCQLIFKEENKEKTATSEEK